jgi:hypothetical protein
MSFGNIAYLALVIAGFAGFFVVLFSGWIWVNWSEWTARPVAIRAAQVRAFSTAARYSKAA